MTRAELQTAIVTAWRGVPGLQPPQALAMANEILKGSPREYSDFQDWFKVYGEAAVKRVAGA